jgi:protein FAM50
MKDSKTKVGDIGSKFTGTTDAAEQEFRRRTIGLVTADDFRKAREVVESAARADQEELEAREAAERDAAKRARAKKRKKTAAALSFADDDGDEEKEENGEDDAIPLVEKKKNPHVDTSHLPDKERDLLRAQEHERLALEWKKEQDIIRQHKLEVTFAYHDGSGHRRTLVLTKGSTIGQFLHKVKVAMQDDFKELKTASADTLMYVKEDLIIPNTISFYDLIVTKARGKSGPLFHFDVHDDIRLTHDSRVEKDESHPGKVVGRWWYEKNKHIFPASRWERYEPTLQRDGPYTVHGGEVRGEVSKKKSADKKKYGEESIS